jgi:uncharacterized phage protein gp47/JayE
MSSPNIQTLSQRLLVIRGRLLNANPGEFSTNPQAFLADLFMAPLAAGDVEQQARTYMASLGDSVTDILAVENDSQMLSLLATALQVSTTTVLSMLSALLDAWGQNFDTPRLQPTYATGQIQLGTVTAPTSNITVNTGVIATTSDGTAFSVTAPVTMYAASAGNYFNTTNYQFTISAPAQAQQAGSAGNAASGTINTLQTSVGGIQFVTNAQAFTGGQDLETDSAYGARLLQIWLAAGRLTAAGLQYYPETLVPGVQDVYVAGPNDPLAQRGGSRTDIWYQGEVQQSVTETFTAYNHPTIPNCILPTYRPCLTLESVSSGTATLVPDITSAVSNSVQSWDRFQFSQAPQFPVQISHIYDAQAAAVQNLYNNPEYAPPAQQEVTSPQIAGKVPILAREAIAIGITYVASIIVMPNYNGAAVRQAVVQALQALAATWTLGTTIYPGTLDDVVTAVPGVLRISGTGTASTFAITGQTGVADQITTGNNEYPYLNTINIF